MILTSVAGPVDAEVTVVKGGCILAAEAGEPRPGGTESSQDAGRARGKQGPRLWCGFPRKKQTRRAGYAGRDWTVWVPKAGPRLQKDLGFPVPALEWGGPAG